jgi:UDPglucose--hexose-1-phosphate uridylyltransferase
MNLSDYPHRRLNPLTGEWVLCSPHRTKRPWQGATEKLAEEGLPAYDPGCYLCPGNERAGGLKNPPYEKTFSFVNDFSALLPEAPQETMDEGGLLVARTETGSCKVICFSPRHDLTLPRMAPADIRGVVDLWVREWSDLDGRPGIAYAQIFENRGAMMGCSNPHPHCQIWATSIVPDLPAKEGERQAAYRREKGSCLLCDYLKKELASGERIVALNEGFVALVPFWAVWPFEMIVLPRRHMDGIDAMSEAERDALADILKRAGTRYDNLFKTNFPYSMGFHMRPTGGGPRPEWHFHLHYYPPLLRSATVRKFMVGYELLAMPQRDITAEAAAAMLKACPERHYRDAP